MATDHPQFKSKNSRIMRLAVESLESRELFHAGSFHVASAEVTSITIFTSTRDHLINVNAAPRPAQAPWGARQAPLAGAKAAPGHRPAPRPAQAPWGARQA